MRLDLRKLEFCVVRVHCHEFLASRRTQDLYDLNELIHAALSGEYWLSKDKFCGDARCGPDVNDCRVVRSAEDEFGSSVIPGADIGHVGFTLDESLSRAEVAEFQRVCAAIHKQVLRLDVTMTDADCVDIGTRSTHLVRIKLHEDVRNWLFHLVVVLHHAIDSVGAVFHHNVQVRLPRFVARRVKGMLQLHHVWMPQLLHDLKLTIFVPFVLKHLFDRDRLARLDDLRLVDDTKRAATKNALCVVRERLLRTLLCGSTLALVTSSTMPVAICAVK
mmetsp:Transcript_63337/g.137841  ORF Transcript_63337/g.137841 Transcript_63337/m.137841 type:complete len:275 (-) Transcript_63337:140-964(-)